MGTSALSTHKSMHIPLKLLPPIQVQSWIRLLVRSLPEFRVVGLGDFNRITAVKIRGLNSWTCILVSFPPTADLFCVFCIAGEYHGDVASTHIDEYGRLVRQHARVKFRAANTNGDVEFVVRSSGPIYGKRVIPPDDASVPLKFSFLKLPVLDVKSEKWKAPDANESRLNDCIFLGYGDTDQDVADGQLRIQENVSVYSANNRLFIPLNFTTKLGRACRGDSGGPLICHDKNGEQRLYGIMSNSETPMPGSKKNCFTDKDTFAFDILTDIRYILPQLRSSLIKMGKLDELIEDYERCGDHRPDQQTNKLNKILGSETKGHDAFVCFVNLDRSWGGAIVVAIKLSLEWDVNATTNCE
ncbi:unnamed protein product [Toxocara canis]|uniref:Peptidase S1 domain-containing protein n=1 Tax=Toxocara canis TaxID=6265 RepID=A0A183UDY6_TOXCA|nr:unnamed protein product [Toxocara canis]